MKEKKVLVRDMPNEGLFIVPWDKGAIKRFKFDEFEIDFLENGDTLFRGDTAFSLEDEGYTP